jgi:hypothetical protein
MATSFKYRVIATDTPNGQREVRFQRLDQRSPMLLALYGPAEKLSEYENGAERDIDPDEHAQIFDKTRADIESQTAAAQAAALQEQGLGVAPEGSDGIAVEGTAAPTPTTPTGKTKVGGSTTTPVDPKLPGTQTPPAQQ